MVPVSAKARTGLDELLEMICLVADLQELKANPKRAAVGTIVEAELDKVAFDGVAFDMEERNVGTCAVAAPVRDQLGKVIAALSIVVPTGRFGTAERPRYAEAVKVAAEILEEMVSLPD